MKNRKAGSVHDAITRAFAQLDGGVSEAAAILGKSRPYVSSMSDPDAEGRHKVNMSLFQAGQLSDEGVTALAEWLSIKAGGVFLPLVNRHCGAAIQEAAAMCSRESGEAVGAAIDAALKGGNVDVAIREMDEAIAMFARTRAKLVAANENGNVTKLERA